MAEQPTTRLAASGHRFLMRRMEHALVRRNIAMHDDPLRAQSLSPRTQGESALTAGNVHPPISRAAASRRRLQVITGEQREERRVGAPNTNRTCDLPLRRGLLYPLSYRGAAARIIARRVGWFAIR